MSNVYSFYVSSAGLGLGLGTAGLDHKAALYVSIVRLVACCIPDVF